MRLKEASERVLLLFSQAGEDGLINAPIHQCANAPGHAIQPAKGGQFAVFLIRCSEAKPSVLTPATNTSLVEAQPGVYFS
jgi:hypothetical protein